MNRSIKLFAALTLTAGLLGGCASNPAKLDYCTFPDAPGTQAPEWVCSGPVEGIPVSAVGSYRKSAAGYNFMKQQATASARIELASQFQTYVKNLVKQYSETTGTGDSETVDQVNSAVSKVVTTQHLEGSKILKTQTSPNGDLYILVGLDKDATIFETQKAIRTSMNDARAAWQKFQSNKAHEELNKEIEEFQRSQMM